MIESRVAATKPIRVAYVMGVLQLPAGGTERQLLHLLKGMDRTCFDPTVFCLRTADDSIGHTKILSLRLHLSRSLDALWRIWKFSGILLQGSFDIVQTHLRDSNIIGVLADWRAGTPTIVSMRRGVPYWESGGGFHVLRWLNGRVSRFIANLMATRDRYSREEGFDPARVDVVYNGLEPGWFGPLKDADRARLREELGLPITAPVIGIVANLRRVKGLKDFLQAVALVGEEFPAAHFVIVGQSTQEKALKKRSTALGLRRQIRFLGDRADVPQLLQIFDIGVLASHWESFSNAVLEYVAVGLPVVVTDVGGVRKAIEDGREGFIVPAKALVRMAAKIRFLLAHPGGPRAWRTNKGIDKTFYVRSMVEGQENLYEQIHGLRIRN